jgi:hypothetical protein
MLPMCVASSVVGFIGKSSEEINSASLSPDRIQSIFHWALAIQSKDWVKND